MPDLVRLSELGLTTTDLGLAVRASGDGAIIGEYHTAGESIDLTITYAGTPQAAGGFLSFGWNKYRGAGDGEMAWSLSEPEGARTWWPLPPVNKP